LLTLRVLRLSTLPPLILVPGQSPSHEQNACALRQRLMSVPISLKKLIVQLVVWQPVGIP